MTEQGERHKKRLDQQCNAEMPFQDAVDQVEIELVDLAVWDEGFFYHGRFGESVHGC